MTGQPTTANEYSISFRCLWVRPRVLLKTGKTKTCLRMMLLSDTKSSHLVTGVSHSKEIFHSEDVTESRKVILKKQRKKKLLLSLSTRNWNLLLSTYLKDIFSFCYQQLCCTEVKSVTGGSCVVFAILRQINVKWIKVEHSSSKCLVIICIAYQFHTYNHFYKKTLPP